MRSKDEEGCVILTTGRGVRVRGSGCVGWWRARGGAGVGGQPPESVTAEASVPPNDSFSLPPAGSDGRVTWQYGRGAVDL